MKPVTLRAKGLILDALTEDDLPKLWHNGYNQKTMWIYFKRKVVNLKQFTVSYKRKIIAGLESEKETLAWCIRKADTKEPVGMIDVHDDWELSWSIAPAFQGNGYCVEAARAVLYYLFNKVGAKYVMVKIAEDDKPSALVALTLEFQFGSSGYMLSSIGDIIPQSYYVKFAE